MMSFQQKLTCVAFGLLLCLCVPNFVVAQSDPLDSWNAGPAKKAILEFVSRVTKEGGPDYIDPPERIATFDNDGTLLIEQPNYTQIVFAIDRVTALASQHPEWKDQEPYKSILTHDLKR
jgi:hypothetical protein